MKPENNAPLPMNTALLAKLVDARMPFGKYAGQLLIDLPEPYLVWFGQQGFPQGELGALLASIHAIKVEGLEYLLEPLRKKRE